jgi:hypothetical protein
MREPDRSGRKKGFKRPRNREICMLEYTLGSTAKNAEWNWRESSDWALSLHREKLMQLKAELEGMMVLGEPTPFVRERLEALHADVSRELRG